MIGTIKEASMIDEIAVQQVMARYVRATDRRDGTVLAELFEEVGAVEIFHRLDGTETPLGMLEGRPAIAMAVATMMKPHGTTDWSHHTTFDPIVAIEEQEASLDVQFIVYAVEGAPTPAGGWGAEHQGAQGTIRPIEAGYYRAKLRKRDGQWRFERLAIHHDMPFAVPNVN
jgi:hypothetical protein